MRLTKTAATLVLAFLLGGSSAEMALKTRRALERHRAAADEEGSAGELVSFEIHDPEGRIVARPRLIATPGRVSEVLLRDPEHPEDVRLDLRVETERQPSGDLLVTYALALPSEQVLTRGRVTVTPGVEQEVELGDYPLVATLFTVPVPSAAFDAYLDAERLARRGAPISPM